MAKTNIGRVSVVPKDEYSSTENYKRLDVVSSDGSMYISKKDNNIGNPLTDKNWWFKAVEKGEVGAQGEKPVNGVDYNTDEEKEEFKNDVVSKATEEVEKNIADIEAEAIENYNNNADAKTEEYDTNANSKVEEYNSNATQKTNTFNKNATTQTEIFNNNATNKTNSFDENATAKTNDFNSNYDEKLADINEASTSIDKERIESEKKYAKAIDSDLVEINEFGQVECDTEGYMKYLEIESTLPEITQDLREGYNKLDISTLQELDQDDVKLTKENGVVTLNGKSTATSFIDAYIVGSSSNYEEFLTAGKYTVSGITGEALSPNFGILIVIKHTDETTITIIQNSENKVFNVVDGDTFRIFIRIPQNLQLNNIVIRPMIVSGTENKDFEQYGASPSLNYPSEFKNILSSFNIKNTVNEIEKYNKQITLPENKFLGSFNDYKNTIKNGKLNNNLKIYKVDSSTDFSINATDDNRVQFLTPVIDDLKPELGQNDILSNIAETSGSSSTKKIRFWISYEELGTTSENTNAEHIAALKNKLSNITGEFLYPVDNEEETSLEDINLALYQGINNISSEDLKVDFKYNISIEKYVEENNANERKISDNKYPRALKTKVEDVQQTQIYADNSKVENLIIKGTQLTQDVTEQSENIILLEDYSTKNNNGIDVTVKDNKITLNGTATAAFNLQLPIKYIAKKSITGDWCLGYISSGDLSSGNGNIQVYGSNNQNIQIYFPKSSNPLINYTKKTFDNVELNTAHINIYMNNSAVADNIVIDFTLANVASLDAGIPFTPNSPSLDFPSKIQVLSQQNMQICKSNLFNTEDFINELKKIFTVTEEVVDGVDCYKIIRTVDWQREYEVNIKCKSIIKFKYKKEAEGGIIVKNNDGTYKALSNTSELSEFENTSQGGFKSIRIELYSTTYPIYISKDIQINCGDISLEYESYKGQKFSIPLQNLAIGDYSDVIDKDKAIQNKLVQEIIFDGTENWILGNEKEKTKVFHISVNMTAVYGIGICNYLPYKSNVDEELINYAGNAIYIAINKTRLSNAEELKALLAQLYQLGKPMKLYLVRQDAIKISLPEEVKLELDKFKLYNDLNNIFIDNGSLSFKYNKSLLRALKEQSELSASLLDRIQALEAAQVNSVGGN